MGSVTATMERVRGGNQDPVELAQFLNLVRTLNVRSYVEIGCRNGDTFHAVMNTIGAGGYGLAIDIPENANAKKNLVATIAELNAAGIVADVIFGDSHSRGTIERTKARGPFDLILIDGDHRYQGVNADFEAYRDLAPVIVLHDVTAPRGHMSDGHENGVGVFWNEIKHGFRHQEFVTPGSLMGFGVVYQDAKVVAAKTTPPILIACPAWGEYNVGIACRFTIPAILASLKESNFSDVTFLIHTDDKESFRKAIGDHKTKFMDLLPMTTPPESKDGKMPRLPDNYWWAFKQAHKDAINVTPQGAICTLLNADVIVSRECFSYVERELTRGKKVVASVGIRTQIENNDGPPIGASAKELFVWIWKNKHHITAECCWGTGRSHHPTILFFDDGDGNVEMRMFHATPMFILKDRALQFKGTIDDDLLAGYRDDEVRYVNDGAVAFAEISPNWKEHPFGKPLNVADVLGFWSRRRLWPHYLRNFRQRMTVLGKPAKNHAAVDQIIAGLSR